MKRADIKADGKTRYLIDNGQYANRHGSMVAVVEEIVENVTRRNSWSQPKSTYRALIRYVIGADYTTTVVLSKIRREWTAEDDAARDRMVRLEGDRIRSGAEARRRLNAALAAAGVHAEATSTTSGLAITIRVDEAHVLAGHLESWSAAHAAALALPRDPA